jgi:hypothetical protein
MTIRDRKEGGAARVVRVLTSDDLKENGGRYTISSKIAIPVTVDEANRKITGGPIGEAVYIVTDAEIAAGDFKVGGSSSLTVVDSSVLVPARSSAHGFQATPVYVVSGTLGESVSNILVDENGDVITFETGDPFNLDDIVILEQPGYAGVTNALDNIILHNNASGESRRALVKNFGASTGPEKVRFRMYKSSNQTIGSGWTKVQFQVTLYDTHSGVDLANNRYTVPSGADGLWLFFCQIYPAKRWRYTRVNFRVNGTSYFHRTLGGDGYHDNTACDNTQAEAVFLWQMDVGDYVEAWSQIYTNTTVQSGAFNSFLSGMRVGL